MHLFTQPLMCPCHPHTQQNHHGPSSRWRVAHTDTSSGGHAQAATIYLPKTVSKTSMQQWQWRHARDDCNNSWRHLIGIMHAGGKIVANVSVYLAQQKTDTPHPQTTTTSSTKPASEDGAEPPDGNGRHDVLNRPCRAQHAGGNLRGAGHHHAALQGI